MPSFAGDPAYAMAVLNANRDFQASQGQILQNMQHGFLQLGNPEFARAFYANNWLRNRNKQGKVTGQLTPFEKAQMQAIQANANPDTGTSTFAQLGRQYALQREQLNNELNAANLFYSGYRGKQLGQLGQEEQFSKANALYGAQNALDEQFRQLTAARSTRRDALTAAAQAAYTRLLAQRLGA